MEMTNVSAVLQGVGDLRMEERPIPEPGPGCVQIKIHSVGICGTDISFWKNGAVGKYKLSEPVVLGHEPSGVVTKVGPGVTSITEGDRVALEPSVPCSKCNLCKTGRYNICKQGTMLATPPIDGAACQYLVHNADFCYKLPESMSLVEGALLQPLSVGVHACRRGGLSLGQNVLITGAGSIGLMCLLTARAMGAAKIVVTEKLEHRLSFAIKIGADQGVLVTSSEPEVVVDDVVSILGCFPDVVMECSGSVDGVRTAFDCTRPGGVMVQVGLPAKEVSIPITDAAVKEMDIRGVIRYPNAYPTAISMVASGLVNVKPLVSHHFALDEAVEAFETARDRADGTLKVMIDCFRFSDKFSGHINSEQD